MIEQSLDEIPKKIHMIFYIFQEKMKELDNLKNSLTKYMEINNSTAQELKLAGCIDLARQKQILCVDNRWLTQFSVILNWGSLGRIMNSSYSF